MRNLTTADKLAENLAKAGIPARKIHCYGSQVMITTSGLNSANEWVSLLQKFCATVRKPARGYDDKFINGYQPPGKKSHIPVWRIWGTI